MIYGNINNRSGTRLRHRRWRAGRGDGAAFSD